MKVRLAILLLAILILACRKQSEFIEIEGEIYTKAIDLRFFQFPDTALTNIETRFKNFQADTFENNQKGEYDFVQFLIQNRLLRRPYVRVILDNGEKTMVFLDNEDYEKILSMYKELSDDPFKIKIEAEVNELKYAGRSIFNARRLTSITKASGRAHYEK